MRRGVLDDRPVTTEVPHRLAQARLLTLGENTVEIAHEALIRSWPRLRSWLTEDRDSLRIHRQVTEATDTWETLDRYRWMRTAHLGRGKNGRYTSSGQWQPVDLGLAKFHNWAQDYHEMPIGLDAMQHIYAGQPLTADVVTTLNPATTLAAVADRVVATGYPIRGLGHRSSPPLQLR